MTTLSPNTVKSLILANLSAKTLLESLQLLAKPRGGYSVADTLLTEHAGEMLLDFRKLVTKLDRLVEVTETNLPIIPLPEYEEFEIPEANLKRLVDQLTLALAFKK